MSKKFMFYLKDVDRPIVVTDSQHKKSMEETEDEISKLLSESSKILSFSTKRDSLVVRPNDIRGVFIQTLDKKKETEVPESFDFSENEIHVSFEETGGLEENKEPQPKEIEGVQSE